MKSLLCRGIGVIVCGLSLIALTGLLLTDVKAAEKGDDPKEALQELQEFIGGWKGSVASGANKQWNETSNWSWRFKGKDVWMSLDIPEGKIYKAGDLRFLSDKGKYQLTLVDKKDAKSVFLGDFKKGTLTVERKTAAGDVEQVKMNTAGGGVRFITTLSLKPADRTLFNKQFQAAYTKEGESFGVAAGQKGPECVVTGGLGTMAVSFMGTTYYVCCTGCRDAFNENPAKIVAEYKARKAKGS